MSNQDNHNETTQENDYEFSYEQHVKQQQQQQFQQHKQEKQQVQQTPLPGCFPLQEILAPNTAQGDGLCIGALKGAKATSPVPDVQVGENRDDNTTNNNNNNKRLKVLSVSDYRVVSQIGRGGFAEVFKVESVKNPGCVYAMKLSKKMPANTSQSDFNKYASYSFYMKEWKAYERLSFGRKDANGVLAMDYGIPKIYEKGVLKVGASGLYPYMIMQLLGPSMSNFIKPGSGLSSETFIKFGTQIIQTIQYIHSKGLIHRDVKPSNMCVSINLPDLRVFIIDMGFAKEAPDPHYYNENDTEDFVGTPDYASDNSLRGKLQGFKDDIEQLGFTLLELLLGDLPWNVALPYGSKSGWSSQQLYTMADTKLEEIRRLDEGGYIPAFWKKWMEYVSKLGVFDKPDYGYLQELIQNIPNEPFKNIFITKQ